MRQIGMLDLQSEYRLFADDIRAVVDEVLSSQWFVGGPAVGQLEEALADRVGVDHAIAVSSGTDALLCTLMALNVGSGDEVILPSFTFFATAGSVSRVGAKPVFVDIDERTFNMTPEAVEAAVTAKTKAIIVVHLFGQCVEMDAINAIAARHGISVIEDAAQAIDATYHGRRACSLGDAACMSFYPTKNLGGFGEGGMIFTSDEKLAEIARQLRNHGESRRYVHERVGGNFRLDTMKAAILLVKLDHLDEFTRHRRKNAATYNELLADTPVTTPHVPEHQRPVYHQYSILCERRDELALFLKDRGVGSGVYYAVPLHLQECFESVGSRKGDLPVTERTCDRILSLPCHPMLSEDDLNHVAFSVREFYAGSTASSGESIEKPAAMPTKPADARAG